MFNFVLKIILWGSVAGMAILIVRKIFILKSLPMFPPQKQQSEDADIILKKEIEEKKGTSLFLISFLALKTFKEKIAKIYSFFLEFLFAGLKKIYLLKNFFIKIFLKIKDIKTKAIYRIGHPTSSSDLAQDSPAIQSCDCASQKKIILFIKFAKQLFNKMGSVFFMFFHAVKRLNFSKIFFKISKPKEESVIKKTKLSGNYWSKIKRGLKMSK